MLAIAAAMTEISQFADFMVGDKCDALNKVLETLLKKQTKGKCFDVATQLNSGAWLLFAAALISSATAYFVMAIAKTAIHERHHRKNHLYAAPTDH